MDGSVFPRSGTMFGVWKSRSRLAADRRLGAGNPVLGWWFGGGCGRFLTGVSCLSHRWCALHVIRNVLSASHGEPGTLMARLTGCFGWDLDFGVYLVNIPTSTMHFWLLCR